MTNKILVPISLGYSSAIRGLGEFTDDVNAFLRNPEEFKLVLFTGGEDVDPAMYDDESPRNYCGSSLRRDEFEARIFKCALDNNIKMTGICRGSQFLNVMCGGRMMHHIDHHAGTMHKMVVANGEEVTVNSFHHQMSVPGPKAVLLGWAEPSLSNVYIGRMDEPEVWDKPETEALVWPEFNAAGVQYHPEMMSESSEGYKFYFEFVKNLLELGMNDFLKKYTNAKAMAGGKSELRRS
jgi:GMP synthase-like glutamine amidotransferase